MQKLKQTWYTWSLLGTRETMVEIVKISKKGKLLRIKEISDKYREKPYIWDEDEE